MPWKITIWVSSTGIPRIGIRGIKDWKDECDDYDTVYGSQIPHRCVVYDIEQNRYSITTPRKAKKLGLPFLKF